MRGKAILFGLNYVNIPRATLNGCINDVKQISQQIHTLFDGQLHVDVFTDDIDRKNTSYDGIVQNLYDAAIQSYSDDLDFVWVHFSGHGSQKKDTSGDELDYMDEGICPSDFHIKGILIDDILNNVISKFNPKTKVLFVADCCHSGSILDLKYSWNVDARKCKTDNKNCKIMNNVILISGCMDNQTSADAFNLLNDKKHIGALTASFIKVLEKRPQQLYDVFSFVSSVRTELRRGGFNQYPCLSSTIDISKEPSMVMPVHMHNRPHQQSIEEHIFDIPVQKMKAQENPSNAIQFSVDTSKKMVYPPPKLYEKPESAFHHYHKPIAHRSTYSNKPVFQYYSHSQQFDPNTSRSFYYEAQNTFAPQLFYITNITHIPVYPVRGCF